MPDAVAPRRIQQLSTALVNRIAAGEVIERPASVVKELVENALDAGARNVLVEIEDGGRELIRVIDDGHGIPVDDLPLAFAEHATSKIRTDDDLFRIGTMGFRGEALASIGSVSHARICSRTADSQAAWEVVNRGGECSAPQASAGNVGTVLEIRHLFYNTPARRKFMKGAPTEIGHISDTVLRLALPHPGVAFTLTHNGKKSLHLPATDPTSRLLEAWPDDFHEQRLPLDARDAEVKILGLIGLPALARPTAKYQYLYLNGRHIRDRFIQHALREAFRGLTEPGRHPAAILMLNVPPGDVDVNVHPTKIEVRFKDSGRIHGLVLSAVREKLLGSDLTPRAIPFVADNVEPADRLDVRATLASFFQKLPGDLNAPAAPATIAPAPWGLQPGVAPAVRLDFGQAPAAQPGVDIASIGPRAIATPPTDNEPLTTDASAVAPTSPLPTLPSTAIQLHNSYLVTETPEGMLIIDQHALHERIMYEELKARVTRGPLESQRMLIPPTVPATGRQVALLEQIQPLLGRLGIEVSPFGPETLAVHAFPTFLARVDPVEFVTDLLERGEQELLDLHDEELLHEILDMMSCKAAVKAGDPLTAAEIQALLARKDLVDRSSNCPHGRPTTLRLSLRDLEKQFKRTGF
ncbi:MAG TPA: DNA mismatch repair endonuclease MutL [Tepidisphaeraceae bacterium]|nr:DNA mismatch repair endonuclease MutL [Tepidisphaeraceae bacterium]